MNDFTKEELEDLLEFVEIIRNGSRISEINYGLLSEKIQYMIDRHQKEEEIFCCHSAFVVDESLFLGQECIERDFFKAPMHAFTRLLDGKIRNAGAYNIVLRLVKMK